MPKNTSMIKVEDYYGLYLWSKYTRPEFTTHFYFDRIKICVCDQNRTALCILGLIVYLWSKKKDYSVSLICDRNRTALCILGLVYLWSKKRIILYLWSVIEIELLIDVYASNQLCWIFFCDMWKKMQIFMKNKLLVGGTGGSYKILWVHLQLTRVTEGTGHTFITPRKIWEGAPLAPPAPPAPPPLQLVVGAATALVFGRRFVSTYILAVVVGSGIAVVVA